MRGLKIDINCDIIASINLEKFGFFIIKPLFKKIVNTYQVKKKNLIKLKTDF